MQHQRHAHRLEAQPGQLRARGAWREGGSLLPDTCEKLTPPRSNSLPSSMTQVMPPPPSARSQVSAAERRAVERLERGDDARLQRREVVADRAGVHVQAFFSARDRASAMADVAPYCMPSKRIAPTVS